MVCNTPLRGTTTLAKGTPSGYMRHRRAGESPCDACQDAKRLESANWRVANPEKELASSKKWKRLNADQKRDADRVYRDGNRERIRGFARRWYYDNKEKAFEHARHWQRANPDKRAAIDKRWRYNHPDQVRHKNSRQRARRANTTIIGFSSNQLAQKMAYWGNQCWMCGGPFEAVDHVKPIAVGGAHILSNLRPSCQSCNSSKGSKWPL